jgi:hypothetical protein
MLYIEMTYNSVISLIYEEHTFLVIWGHSSISNFSLHDCRNNGEGVVVLCSSSSYKLRYQLKPCLDLLRILIS